MVASCRQQGRLLLDFLGAARAVVSRGSLLPSVVSTLQGDWIRLSTGSAIGAIASVIVVALASSLPFLSTLHGYFLADDFGAVQLLSQKPPLHVLSLFTMPWTESIYGALVDELRPTLALSFQVNSLWGATAPESYHVMNIALHVANALLVLAIARRAAGISLPAAMFAGALFAVLPIHAETVAWIGGRSDSIPTLFYLTAFLAYVLWRQSGRGVAYVVAVGAFFLALFSKQSAITMLVTVAAYEWMVRLKPLRLTRSDVLTYGPFLVLTVGYLALRFVLFGNAVRENQLTPERLVDVPGMQWRALQRLVSGASWGVADDGSVYAQGMHAVSPLLGLIGIAVALLLLHAAYRELRSGAEQAALSRGRRLLYFGPVWWLIGTAPLVVTYESPRHLYLASVGVAVALGLSFDALWSRQRRGVRFASMIAGAVLILASALILERPVNEWNFAAELSQGIIRDVERETAAAPPGSLLVLLAPPYGDPARGWQDRIFLWTWALPFAIQPPFTQTDLTERAYIIHPQSLYCCSPQQWFAETRQTVRAWAQQPDRLPVIVLIWYPSTGELIRRSDLETPQVRSLVLSLPSAATPDEMDRKLETIRDTLGR